MKDLLKESKKQVFHCYIIGSNQCGKVIIHKNSLQIRVHFLMHLLILNIRIKVLRIKEDQ
jgi:hypothetical protein